MDDVEVDVSCLRAIFQGYAGVIHENIEPADFLIDEIRRGTQAAGARDVEGDKLLKKQMRPPRVMITDKLASYGAAKRETMPGIASIASTRD